MASLTTVSIPNPYPLTSSTPHHMVRIFTDNFPVKVNRTTIVPISQNIDFSSRHLSSLSSTVLNSMWIFVRLILDNSDSSAATATVSQVSWRPSEFLLRSKWFANKYRLFIVRYASLCFWFICTRGHDLLTLFSRLEFVLGSSYQ